MRAAHHKQHPYLALLNRLNQKAKGLGYLLSIVLVIITLAAVVSFTYAYAFTTAGFVKTVLNSKLWAFLLFCSVSVLFNCAMSLRGAIKTIPALPQIFQVKGHAFWCFILAALNSFAVTATLFEERIMAFYPVLLAFCLARFVIILGAVDENVKTRHEHTSGPFLDVIYISLSFIFNFAFFLGTTKFLRLKLNSHYHPTNTALSAFTHVSPHLHSILLFAIAVAGGFIANLAMAYLSANSLKLCFGVFTRKLPLYAIASRRKHILKNIGIISLGALSAVAAFFITANQFGGISVVGVIAGLVGSIVPAMGVNSLYMVKLLDETYFKKEINILTPPANLAD